MNRIEEAIVTRWPGTRIMKASALLGLGGVAPLPIGLGLLAFFTLPVAMIGLAVRALNGAVYARSGPGGRLVSRDESPEYFWIVIAIYAGLSVALFTVF